jgi:hypothetical protein
MIDAGDELFGRCCGVVSCPRSVHGLMMWRELLGLLLVVGRVISIFERPSGGSCRGHDGRRESWIVDTADELLEVCHGFCSSDERKSGRMKPV